MIQQQTIEKFAKDFEAIKYGTWNMDYTFEQEQGDDLIEVSATISPKLQLLQFNVCSIDLDGKRKDSTINEYQRLYAMACAKLNDLYEEVRNEIQ